MRAQRPALAQRYAIHLPLDLGDVASRFVGTDIATGQTVVVAFMAPERARSLSQGIGALQRHLAGLLAAVDAPNPEAFPNLGETPPSGTAMAAELIRGRTLAEVVRLEPLIADRAVAWTIRILEGLQALHQRQVPHGALSTHSVIAEPKGRPIAPVVSQLIVPPLLDYASPERLNGSGPTIADDLWAVGMLLFEMLVGRLPFHADATTWGRCEIALADSQQLRTLSHGRELDVIVKRVLSADRNRRPGSADELLDMLDRWEQRIALPVTVGRVTTRSTPLSKAGHPAPGDRLATDFEGGGKRLEATLDAAEQMRHSVLSDGPPHPTAAPRAKRSSSVDRSSLQPAAVTKSNRPGPAESRRRMSSLGPEMAAFRERSRPKIGRWLLVLALLGGLAAAGVYLLGFRDDKGRLATAPSVQKAAELAAPASSNVPERPHLTERQGRSLCIQSYFRPDTIAEGTDLGFVCAEEDFLAVNRRLNGEFLGTTPMGGSAAAAGMGAMEAVAERGPSPTGPAMIVRSGVAGKGWQLGWYELVATAIIRQNCCREAAPIKLPESTGWCQQLQSVVRRIAADSVKVGDISPGVRTFDEAITCLLAQGRPVAYPYKSAPTSLQKSAFQQFLKHAAEVDARRAARR
jgi:hypothetical protein